MNLFSISVFAERLVLSLRGESPCSGLVGVEHGDNTYWLSGSKTTWNRELADLMCRETNCGRAVRFQVTPIAGVTGSVAKTSYICTPDATSLSDCVEVTPPSDHNDTIATVTCSGNVRTWLNDHTVVQYRVVMLFACHIRNDHSEPDQQVLGKCQRLLGGEVWRRVSRGLDGRPVGEAV